MKKQENSERTLVSIIVHNLKNDDGKWKLLIAALIIILIIFLSIYELNESLNSIQEVGLKNILMPIWEGTG